MSEGGQPEGKRLGYLIYFLSGMVGGALSLRLNKVAQWGMLILAVQSYYLNLWW